MVDTPQNISSNLILTSSLTPNTSLSSTVIPPPTQLISNVTAKCDSGAPKHYFTVNDQRALTNIQSVTNGPIVGLPDGTTIQGAKSGTVPLRPTLSLTAQKAHIFPGIKSSSLISLG